MRRENSEITFSKTKEGDIFILFLCFIKMIKKKFFKQKCFIDFRERNKPNSSQKKKNKEWLLLLIEVDQADFSAPAPP